MFVLLFQHDCIFLNRNNVLFVFIILLMSPSTSVHPSYQNPVHIFPTISVCKVSPQCLGDVFGVLQKILGLFVTTCFYSINSYCQFPDKGRGDKVKLRAPFAFERS